MKDFRDAQQAKTLLLRFLPAPNLIWGEKKLSILTLSYRLEMRLTNLCLHHPGGAGGFFGSWALLLLLLRQHGRRGGGGRLVRRRRGVRRRRELHGCDRRHPRLQGRRREHHHSGVSVCGAEGDGEVRGRGEALDERSDAGRRWAEDGLLLLLLLLLLLWQVSFVAVSYRGVPLAPFVLGRGCSGRHFCKKRRKGSV